ncbi:MAG: hypothetical protein MUE47_10350 [Acidobacteria bacterium]|jgi:hypothetical protein|nr:hypothetical protein [Acidobacteriota bacterium]MCU0314101.1 hypothetical protein [Solirubrobacteraceae bacterium]
MRRVIALSCALAAAAPGVAHGAAKPGAYKGTSKGRYVQVGQAKEPTDTGRVSFRVSANKVSDLRLRGQLVQCGPPNEIPVTVRSIRLNAQGKGTGRYDDPDVGRFDVTITVTSTGRATGRIVGRGLCSSQYPVTFSARRS